MISAQYVSDPRPSAKALRWEGVWCVGIEGRPAWVALAEAGKVGEDEPGEVGSGQTLAASSALRLCSKCKCPRLFWGCESHCELISGPTHACSAPPPPHPGALHSCSHLPLATPARTAESSSHFPHPHYPSTYLLPLLQVTPIHPFLSSLGPLLWIRVPTLCMTLW